MATTNRPGGHGAQIRALRRAAGLTLDQLSDAAGVSKSYLSRVENGLLVPTDGWISMVALAVGDHLASQSVAVSA